MQGSDDVDDQALHLFQGIKRDIGVDPHGQPPEVIEMPQEWDTRPPLKELLEKLAAEAAQRRGYLDVDQFLKDQEELMDWEARDAAADAGGPGEAGGYGAAAAIGGSPLVASGHQDSVQVGSAAPDRVDSDAGRPLQDLRPRRKKASAAGHRRRRSR